MPTKKSLRATYKTLRKSLSEEEILTKNQAIHNLLLDFLFKEKSTIHCFLPIAHLLEINTLPIIKSLQQKGFILVVPKVKDTDLEHYIFQDQQQIAPQSYKIPEPLYGEIIPARAIDYVIVPLLAWDKKGNRLGYGKGFYDRFLSQCHPDCITLGINWFEPLAQIPTEVHDHKLDFGISPGGLVAF